MAFKVGRVDTRQKLTVVEMFTWLKPVADGFRNYHGDAFADGAGGVAREELFLDGANLMKLTAPEWTALTGGLRALNLDHDGSDRGVLTDRVGVLTTDFFRVLTDTDLVWETADERGTCFVLKDRASGEVRHRATREDLVFGSNVTVAVLTPWLDRGAEHAPP